MSSPERGESSILDVHDQQIAQNLYDFALSRGGTLRNDSDGVTEVTVTGRKKRSQSMEIYVGGNGSIETRLRRGRQSWQDDGSHGETGGFGSKLSPEGFHSTLEQRRGVLRSAAERFLPSQPQSQ